MIMSHRMNGNELGFIISLKKPINEYSVEEFVKEFNCGCSLIDLYDILKERSSDCTALNGKYLYSTGGDPYAYLSDLLRKEISDNNSIVKEDK